MVSSAQINPSIFPPSLPYYPFFENRFTRKGASEREMVVLSGSMYRFISVAFTISTLYESVNRFYKLITPQLYGSSWTRLTEPRAGAHKIGITHCGLIQAQVYNSTGPEIVDPILEPTMAAQLNKQCPFGAVMNEVLIDPTSGSNNFDCRLFSRAQNNQAVFISDAASTTNVSGRAIVLEEAPRSNAPFLDDFAAAMEKMSKIQGLSKPANLSVGIVGFSIRDRLSAAT